ncbi:MAG TPA: hypothetical protein VD999_00120, partial [Vitreimonas sp.]|nr:hypothetical protein [Vitreimonas sp.]
MSKQMSIPLTHPENVSTKSDFLNTCCKNQKIDTMRDFRTTINDEGRYEKQSIVDKFCRNCFSRWHEFDGVVQFFTAKQWEQRLLEGGLA